jgi:TonB-linked SusC/RagA family outer membrane protein
VSNRVHRPTRAAARWAAALGLTWAAGFAAVILSPGALAAQESGRITGTVTGDRGEPLTAVQVAIPNTRFGATTSADGRFTIAGLTPGTYQVRAQRLGYTPLTQTAVVTAGEATTVTFQLQAVPTSLAAVVTVGYTTQQRRDVSDATAGIQATDIREHQVATVEEALRGRLPGVTIAASGEPGRPAQIIIRGQNFLGNAAPLYVVDGMYVRQNPNLNPDEIESIEVLKDASAAAQYGAQAANGVVVIRTRRGRSGDTRVELRSYYGTQDVPKRVEMMNYAEWSALARQAYQNANLPPVTGVVTQPTLCDAAGNCTPIDTDWQDAVFRRGGIMDHNLSVSGGGQAANYMISGGFLEQRGSIIETGFRRQSFRVNAEARRGRLTIGENLALASSRRQFVNGFPLIDVVRFPPAIAVYDTVTDRSRGGYGTGYLGVPTYGTNPVGALQLRDNMGRSNQVIGSAYGEYTLLSNLRYRLNVGVSYEDFTQRDFYRAPGEPRYLNPLQPARFNQIQDDNTSLLIENLLTYESTFGTGAHRLNAVAGVTEQQQRRDRLRAFREGFVDPNLQVIDAGQRANLDNEGNRFESALRAFLFRANYAFQDRYLLTGSIRRDGSSRFGANNRYGTFGALSVGWVVSQENFYRGLPLVGGANYLKLRASHGVLGNQDIGDYRYDAPINQGLNYLFGNNVVVGGATQLILANPNIRWQSNRMSNIGLDLGLLGDRLTVTADYYISDSDGLLVSAPIPWSIGASVRPEDIPVVNAGSVRNSGFELGVGHHMERGELQLNTNLTLTTTRNKVTELGNGGQPIFAGPFGVARTTVGAPIGHFYVKKTAGIFQNAAEVTAHGAQPDAQPGDVRYVDLNGDGRIDAGDRYNAGSGVPAAEGGLFVDGRLRQIDFAVNLRGSWGAEIFNVARFWTDRMDDISNFRRGLRPWTPENPSTSTPRAAIGIAGAANADPVSDRWIESGSYLRIQNVTLGYRLPSGVGRMAGLPSVEPRVYLSVQNLHTFTSFSNWDPEVLGFGDPLARGIDDGAIYPNVRTISIGLDLRM